jgi:acetyltransferase-like isoleucine patch superfamily enzyme
MPKLSGGDIIMNNPSGKPMEVQSELFAVQESKIQKYQRLVVGSPGLWGLIKYELVVLCTSWVPGALGLFLRSKFYPKLLKHCGRNVTFGANVLLRHPQKISIGNNVVIDDNCLLDAKGASNQGISIGNGVFIGRNSILSCQNGNIIIKDKVNIGFYTDVFSASSVSIDENTLVAAYCYLIGGGHAHGQPEQAFADQPRVSRGITVGRNVWLGAGVMVQDGVAVGSGALIGTGAVVTADIPADAIAVGVPARVRAIRGGIAGEAC